jgi:GTP-binding protein
VLKMQLPSIAIVGRPNVGKSALFNRLCGKPKAIVDGIPGVTRDRLYEEVQWQGRTFQIIDTGGLFFNRKNESASAEFQIEIELQVDMALQQCAAIVFVVDNTTGITPLDIEIAHKLRSFRKPVIIAANKVDHPDHEVASAEFFNLSLGDVVPISAKHGQNIGELLDHILRFLPELAPTTPLERNDLIRIAILGRPNVGKSSLYNAMIGEDRSIVSEIPGTTHDAIDSDLECDGQVFRVIDTAGIRKKKKIDTTIEKLSIKQAMAAIERAEICLLLIDPTEGVTKQEQIIAQLIAKAGKSCLLILNKIDKIGEDQFEAFQDHIYHELYFVDYAPLMFISAKQKEHATEIFPLLMELHKEYHKRISTPELNDFLHKAVFEKAPQSIGAKQAKVYYGTQIQSGPPKFALFVSNPTLVRENYKRYLENRLRDEFKFIGSPIFLQFRRKNKEKAER